MGYYRGGRGDFYGSGGYYRGDPGFFSFLGGLGKAALGAIPGVGPIAQAAIGAISGAKPKSAIVKASAAPSGTLATLAGKGMSIIKGHPILSAAGGVGILGAGLAGMGAMRKGKKLSHLALTGVRKKPRMNPTNPRALRRAIRRAHAFERLAKHVIGFSSPRKPKGHMYFKRKRKK
jgi:hypothetical protein